MPEQTVIKKRTSPGTPFITNVAKEVYGSKKEAEEGDEGRTRDDKKTPRDDKKTPRPGGDRGPDRGPDRGQPASRPTLKMDVSQPGQQQFQPTLKLELFSPPPAKPQVPYGIYSPYIPTVTMPGFDKKFLPGAFQNLIAPTGASLMYEPVRMPMQNVYNINLPGPTGGHVEMNRIYENILPGKDNKFTSTTLGERLQLYDYIRQILVNMNDGETIGIESEGQKSLMSYIKFMELNPNYYSPISENPYKGLALSLLIYRSCFPITLDQKSQSVICARNSVGLNIRLYALSQAEYYSYLFRQVVYKEYDVWRELAYYEYVRENIIKKKQSPNFPVLYTFFLSPNRNIDYFSLKKACLTQKDMLTKEYQRFVEVHTLFSAVTPSTEIIRPMSLLDASKKVIAKLPDEKDPVLQSYSGTILILITEAPNHNLYQWASRIYEKDGIVSKMISHGYHDENVWLGILFQIISALYVMQIHGIYMRNMCIEDNVFIKDLQTYGKAMGYWKYVIDGIPFYVPNYGYIVFLDSNFKDIIPEAKTLDRCKREYKIYTSCIFGKKYSMDSIRRKVFENYRNIINTNSFTKEHTQNNVTRPPESIMKLIETMMEDPEQNLGKVLHKYFRQLMNNRVGTLLRKDSELPNIREITGQFKQGELAVEVIEQDLYKWCMVVGSKDGAIVEIITKDDPKSTDFITKDVRIETLRQYSASATVDQNPVLTDLTLSEDEMLETYTIKMD